MRSADPDTRRPGGGDGRTRDTPAGSRKDIGCIVGLIAAIGLMAAMALSSLHLDLHVLSAILVAVVTLMAVGSVNSQRALRRERNGDGRGRSQHYLAAPAVGLLVGMLWLGSLGIPGSLQASAVTTDRPVSMQLALFEATPEQGRLAIEVAPVDGRPGMVSQARVRVVVESLRPADDYWIIASPSIRDSEFETTGIGPLSRKNGSIDFETTVSLGLPENRDRPWNILLASADARASSTLLQAFRNGPIEDPRNLPPGARILTQMVVTRTR
jgi:hypothetical protein